MRPADLARAVKIKPPSISLWLDGTTKSIKGQNLLRAAAALKVTPEWLESGFGKKLIDDPTPMVAMEPARYGDPMIAEAIDLLESMDASTRSEALGFLRVYATKKGRSTPKRADIPLPASDQKAA